MHTKIKILFLLLTATLVFTTCKRYPDGPSISLRTVLNRLTGTYALERYIVNGIDSTNLVPPCNQRNTLAYTTQDGRYFFKFDRNDGVFGIDANGQYQLSNDKRIIDISYGIGKNYSPPFTSGRNILDPAFGSSGSWRIQRLTNKEFWIKATFFDQIYEVHLKKIHSL